MRMNKYTGAFDVYIRHTYTTFMYMGHSAFIFIHYLQRSSIGKYWIEHCNSRPTAEVFRVMNEIFKLLLDVHNINKQTNNCSNTCTKWIFVIIFLFCHLLSYFHIKLSSIGQWQKKRGKTELERDHRILFSAVNILRAITLNQLKTFTNQHVA